MHIGYVSIQQSTSIYKTVQGTFTTTGKREIAVSRSSFIEIFIFKKKNGRMISFSSVNFFSQIIFHTQFRFKNDIRDYLLVFEKNGNIIITKIDILNSFLLIDSINLKKLSNEKYFYDSNFSLDKKNLNFMISGLQRSKFISCIIQNKNLLPIFSNISFEVKHGFIICHCIVSIELKCINTSKFACIETLFNRPYEKSMVLYHIDLQSKSVKRKVLCQLNNTSYFLVYIRHESTKKDLILVISDGFFTLINLSTLEFLIKNLPVNKKRNNNKISRVTSFSSFITKKRIFYLLATEDGDLIKFNLFSKYRNNHFIFNLKFAYLDSINGNVCNVQILSSGFIFLSMETGNHFYFQFISFRKKKSKNNFFNFTSRYKYKNILLIEEFLQNLPIISADYIDCLNFRQNHILLLCGTKTKSSIRLLNYSCVIKRILSEKLINYSTGINIIEIKKKNFYILVSYKMSTSVYYLNKKLGEINDSFFSTDSSTLLAKYIPSRLGIIQSTRKNLRFIKYFEIKSKISEWKPPGEIFITNFSIFEKSVIHIFLIISSFKGILIELQNDGTLIELEFVNLNNSKFVTLFGISMKTKKIIIWDFIVVCGKEEKSVRSYSFNKYFFMKLVGIQLLSSYPLSAKFFFEKKKIFLLISLDDGHLIQANFDKNSGQLKIKRIIKISNFPLYISSGDSDLGVLCFDQTLWILEKKIIKNYSLKQINNGPLDLAECCTNIIITTYENKMKVWKNKKKFPKIYKFLIFDICATPIDASVLNNIQNNIFICFICSEIGFKLLNHQINLNKRKKKFIDSLFSYKIKNTQCTNILFIKSLFELPNQKKIFDFILYRGININQHWKSIYTCKLYKSIDIIIVSSIFLSSFTKNYTPLNKVIENKGKLSCLLCFFIKKKLRYNTNRGGRFDFENKIFYLFEETLFYNFTLSFNCFIVKKLLGKRFIISYGNVALVVEINFNKFQKILQFNASVFCSMVIDILKNKVLTIDLIQGFKIFNLKSKKKLVELIGENCDLCNLVYGKIIDPVTFIFSDKTGNVYLFRQKIYNILLKQKNLVKNCKISLKLICQFIISSPVMKMLSNNFFYIKKNPGIYLVCIDGNIILVKPILNQKYILHLEKVFYKFAIFSNIYHRYDRKSKYKIRIENYFRSYNIEFLYLFLLKSKSLKT